MRAIAKRFGSTQALLGVDLELRPGEVHALVGENGAGKSTLMKIMSGALAADSGEIILDNQRFRPRGPLEARARGVMMVYQELTLAPHLDVASNLLLGMESTRFGFIRRRFDRLRVERVLAELQHSEILPDTPVAQLSTGAQQLVEIARALLVDAKILVLDEPTSSLTQEDARHLFELIRRLKQRGVTIVYISHFLEEVQEIADRLTILRDGESVATGSVESFSKAQIIEKMVGRSLDHQFPRVPHSMGEPVLEIKNLEGFVLPRGVNITLHRGEILGLAGIVGAGRTELLRAIFGLDPVRRGEVRVVLAARMGRTPRDRIAQGLGMLSEDRKEEGLALDQSIADNITYSRLRPYTRFQLLNERLRRATVAQWLADLKVRCTGPQQMVGDLSGGNQQKVALGRLLHQQADVLLLDEPTRGVDIGSKAEIYRIIGELAAQGKSVLFVSSYLPELLGICDRLAVMTRGRLSPVRPIDQWTPEQVMAYATEDAHS